MFSFIWHTVFYNPLYNGLILLIDTIPFADMGIVVILFTAIVKLILFPLSKSAVRTQIVMKKVQKEFDEIKKKFKDKKEEQAAAIMNLYRREGINPFSGIVVLIIQIPIVFALYWIFFKAGLPEVNTSLLYSFIDAPAKPINMELIGLVDISMRSLPIALLAGITQFFQIKLAVPPAKPKSKEPSFKEDLARSMNIQMRYVMPVIVTLVAWQISAVVGLYWLTSNLFAIGQELYIRKTIKREEAYEHEN